MLKLFDLMKSYNIAIQELIFKLMKRVQLLNFCSMFCGDYLYIISYFRA